MDILAWERRPVFNQDFSTLSKTTSKLADVLDILKDSYNHQPNRTPGGRSSPLLGRQARKDFVLGTNSNRMAVITGTVNIADWHPPLFKDRLVVGLMLIEEQVLLRGAVAMRARIGLGHDIYADFEARLDLVPTADKGT